MAIIIWSPTALVDLARIDIYHAAFSDAVADKVVNTIRNATIRLINHPLSAPYIQAIDARKLTVVRYPYVIFYRTDGATVDLLRVRHMSENWLPR